MTEPAAQMMSLSDLPRLRIVWLGRTNDSDPLRDEDLAFGQSMLECMETGTLKLHAEQAVRDLVQGKETKYQELLRYPKFAMVMEYTATLLARAGLVEQIKGLSQHGVMGSAATVRAALMAKQPDVVCYLLNSDRAETVASKVAWSYYTELFADLMSHFWALRRIVPKVRVQVLEAQQHAVFERMSEVFSQHLTDLCGKDLGVYV